MASIASSAGISSLARAATEVVDEAFVKTHCPRVTTAIERMAEWVDA